MFVRATRGVVGARASVVIVMKCSVARGRLLAIQSCFTRVVLTTSLASEGSLGGGFLGGLFVLTLALASEEDVE